MAMNGFYNFLNWFDERAWYPLGRIVGGTVCEEEGGGKRGYGKERGKEVREVCIHSNVWNGGSPLKML